MRRDHIPELYVYSQETEEVMTQSPESEEVEVECVEVYSLGQDRTEVMSWAPEMEEAGHEGVEAY